MIFFARREKVLMELKGPMLQLDLEAAFRITITSMSPVETYNGSHECEMSTSTTYMANGYRRKNSS